MKHIVFFILLAHKAFSADMGFGETKNPFDGDFFEYSKKINPHNLPSFTSTLDASIYFDMQDMCNELRQARLSRLEDSDNNDYQSSNTPSRWTRTGDLGRTMYFPISGLGVNCCDFYLDSSRKSSIFDEINLREDQILFQAHHWDEELAKKLEHLIGDNEWDKAPKIYRLEDLGQLHAFLEIIYEHPGSNLPESLKEEILKEYAKLDKYSSFSINTNKTIKLHKEKEIY